MHTSGGGIPAATTSTSVIAALRQLAWKKYHRLHHTLKGLPAKRLRSLKGMALRWLGRAGLEIPNTAEQQIYQPVTQVDTPESEVVFISCTDLNVSGMIQRLEMDLRKPVVTSNQATFWNALGLAYWG